MNESWPTMNTSMLSPGKAPEEVSPSDLNSLLRGRKYGSKQEDVPFDMCPPVPQYDLGEAEELEQYCKKRGIVGVNFAGMSPHKVLSMLRGKVEGKYAPTTKRGILHG